MGMFSAQRRVRRRLVRTHAQISALRDEIALLVEQRLPLQEDADEARVRAVVSGNSADRRDAREAEGHEGRLAAALERARNRLAELEREERELLSRIEA
jgi:hypothetical protein